MNLKKTIKEFVNSFCKEFDVNPCNDRTVEFCPCRFKLRFSYFCNFNQMLIDLSQEKESPKYKRFLKLICEENRKELQSVDFLAKDIQIRIKNFVNDVEDGRIKVGDIVYFITFSKDVILLELPEQKHFDTYHKSGVFPGDVKYKTLDGETGLAPVATINRISRGNYVADYVLNGKDKSTKMRVEHLSRLARRMGFRVKITQTNKSYRLEFYGDTQKDVNEFVELCNQPEFLSA